MSGETVQPLPVTKTVARFGARMNLRRVSPIIFAYLHKYLIKWSFCGFPC
jgi:hypothetical protein